MCKPAFSAFYFASIYGRNDRKIRGERNNMWSYILYYKTTLSFWKWDDKWTKSWSFRVEKKENEILCMSKGPQSSETLSTIRIQKRRSFKNFYFWRLSSFRIAVYSTFNISQQQFEKREANLRKFKLHFSSLFFVFFFIFISGESTNNFSTGFFFLWHYNKKISSVVWLSVYHHKNCEFLRETFLSAEVAEVVNLVITQKLKRVTNKFKRNSCELWELRTKKTLKCNRHQTKSDLRFESV